MANYFSHKSAAAQASGGFYDVGTIIPWTKSSVLDGFLLCDGSNKLRSAYPELFAVIGVTYGSTNDSNFKLPNLIGRTVFGEGTSNDGTTTKTFNFGESSGATNVSSSVSFPSANVALAGSNLSITMANANVDVGAHNHNWSQNAVSGGIYTGDALESGPQRGKAFGIGGLSNQISNDGPNNSVRGFADGIESASTSQNLNSTSQNTNNPSQNIGFLQVTGSVASGGSGNGIHKHNTNVTGNVSFNQTNLNATTSATSTLSPYGVCRYLIKAQQL